MISDEQLKALLELEKAAYTEKVSVDALGALLRFARKNDGSWNDTDLFPEEEGEVPDEYDARLLVEARNHLRPIVEELLSARQEIATLKRHLYGEKEGA